MRKLQPVRFPDNRALPLGARGQLAVADCTVWSRPCRNLKARQEARCRFMWWFINPWAVVPSNKEKRQDLWTIPSGSQGREVTNQRVQQFEKLPWITVLLETGYSELEVKEKFEEFYGRKPS